MTSSPLTHEISHRFPIAVLHLRGEVTDPDSQRVRSALLDALTQEPTSLVVDLSAVRLAGDGRALSTLADVAGTARRWPGARLLLAGPSSPVTEALTELGVTPEIPVYPGVTEALAVAADDPVPRRVFRRLEPTVEAPRTGRALAAYACWQWDLPEPTTTAQILASELIANAVRHARTPVGFAITLRDGELRLSVLDGVAMPVRMRTPTELDEQGRGLLIVDAVSNGWGSLPLGSGKVVWAAVAVRSPVPAAAGRAQPERPVGPT
jgi:anti-anti-sigma regulatory factor